MINQSILLNKRITKKDIIISMVSFAYLVLLLFYILYEGITKKSGFLGVSGFVEQSNLRKTLGEWYQLVFYTFQTNIYFLIIGSSYVFLRNNQTIKNLFFCASSFLLLCLFAMAVFTYDSFHKIPYEAFKTFFVHSIVPISSFVMLFFIRKEIMLKWKILWINSTYITFYIIMTIIIYYNFSYFSKVDNSYKPLWIYEFLDYDNQIMFVPLPTLGWTVFGIAFVLSISPLIGMLIFLVIKMIFKVRIERTHWNKFDNFISLKF